MTYAVGQEVKMKLVLVPQGPPWDWQDQWVKLRVMWELGPAMVLPDGLWESWEIS